MPHKEYRPLPTGRNQVNILLCRQESSDLDLELVDTIYHLIDRC